jgi:ABC-type nitrate/sulfonate/bicarbonate transport system substrate-binding protein
MNRHRVPCWLFAALMVSAVLAYPAGKESRAAELPTVEVGLPEDGVFGLGGQYIIDKGLDRKHGFVMKPRWAGVADIQRLMAIGAVPIGLAVSEVSLRANIQGTPIRLIQPYQVPHTHLLVSSQAPYKNAADLKGKPLALTTETTSLYNMFDYIMKKRGVNIESDFKLKKFGAAPGIIAVLEKGEVDGVVLWEAHVSRLLASGKYKSIMSLREEVDKLLGGKTVFLSYIGAIESWVKQNPDIVGKLRAAWTESSRGVQEDEAHFRKYAKKFFGVEGEDVVSLAWKRTRTILAPPDLKWPEPASLEAQKSYLRQATELGIFPKEALGAIDQMFVP